MADVYIRSPLNVDFWLLDSNPLASSSFLAALHHIVQYICKVKNKNKYGIPLVLLFKEESYFHCVTYVPYIAVPHKALFGGRHIRRLPHNLHLYGNAT